MKPTLFYTVTAADLGRRSFKANGKVHEFPCGCILLSDVGKRVYSVPADDGITPVLQVENDEQFAARRESVGG